MDADNLLLFRIVLVSGVVTLCSSAPQGPFDITAKSGDDVTFTYTDDALGDADYFYWAKYDPQQTVIIQRGQQQTSDPNKYSFGLNGTYSLTVKQVEPKDGLNYCFFSSKDSTSHCANLVVIDSIKPSVNPSNGLAVGQSANLTCLLEYGSPTKQSVNSKPLSDEQDPQLSMYIGNKVLDAPPGQIYIGNELELHSKSISVNRTIESSDAGQSLVCVVKTTNPAFTMNASTSLNVESATTFARIVYVNKTQNSSSCCNLNDLLNCTTNGYPYPEVMWQDENGKTISQGDKGYAVVKVTKEGRYTWICKAKYKSSITFNDSISITVGNNPSPNTGQNKPDKVGLGVGLGIGLGIPVLAGVIILIVLLSRRNKSAKPYDVKQPEKKTSTQTTGKAPDKNGKGPEPGPRNNVNPNPNPTYTTPVMPEQTGNVAPKNVRDSPGFGDLGVKHIGGSGSNPHLNESFDSQAEKSFESSNRASGNNLQFVGGRTNHSPSAPNTSV